MKSKAFNLFLALSVGTLLTACGTQSVDNTDPSAISQEAASNTSIEATTENSTENSTEANHENSYSEERIELECNGNTLVGLLDKPTLAEGEKCPLVIIMHGITASKDDSLYKTISDDILSMNIATLRFDFDGHGESGGNDYDMTVPKEIEDAKTFYNYAKDLDFVSETIFYGHSLGGVVSGMLAGDLGKENVPLLIQMAPAAVAKDLPSTGVFGGHQVFDPDEGLPDTLKLPNDFTLGKKYLETVSTLPIYETASKYDGKVLLLHGSDDQIVPPSYSEKYNETYSHCEFHLIDGETHIFDKSLDESINYINTFIEKNVLSAKEKND